MKKNVRPQHPFPLIVNGSCSPSQHSAMTSAERSVVDLLEQGNRIVFDIQQKRGLVYRFCRGIETVMEITVRMLAALIKKGSVIPVAREGRLVHFALAGSNTWWYDPE